MHVAKLRMVGGSVMFAIPKAILDGLGLLPNSQVGVTVADGRLIVEACPRPRYTLAGLLSQCDADAPQSEETGQWLEGKPVGRELL
jgi:antitoxin ChpS